MPLMIWLMWVWLSPVAWASRYWLMPSGMRKSSARISPGVIGSCAGVLMGPCLPQW